MLHTLYPLYLNLLEFISLGYCNIYLKKYVNHLNLNNFCHCIKHKLSFLQKKLHTEKDIILHTCSKA